jgi:hypothetical protein
MSTYRKLPRSDLQTLRRLVSRRSFSSSAARAFEARLFDGYPTRLDTDTLTGLSTPQKRHYSAYQFEASVASDGVEAFLSAEGPFVARTAERFFKQQRLDKATAFTSQVCGVMPRGKWPATIKAFDRALDGSRGDVLREELSLLGEEFFDLRLERAMAGERLRFVLANAEHFFDSHRAAPAPARSAAPPAKTATRPRQQPAMNRVTLGVCRLPAARWTALRAILKRPDAYAHPDVRSFDEDLLGLIVKEAERPLHRRRINATVWEYFCLHTLGYAVMTNKIWCSINDFPDLVPELIATAKKHGRSKVAAALARALRLLPADIDLEDHRLVKMLVRRDFEAFRLIDQGDGRRPLQVIRRGHQLVLRHPEKFFKL